MNESIETLFTYHAPNEDQMEKLVLIRSAAKNLAETIDECVPICADQAAAMRLLRECVMTANAGLVLNGRGFVPTGSISSKTLR